MADPTEFDGLLQYLSRVPGIQGPIGRGRFGNGNWWTKFTIDIAHPLAWNVVQEFGFVLNFVSLEERLPTIFMPVSPPPYLNGGPRQFLSWVIESKDPAFTPDLCTQWLEGRLPQPVDDDSQWPSEP